MKTRLGDAVIGTTCLKFGRDVTRIQCSIAYAIDALKRRAPRHMDTVEVGLLTTKRAATEIEAITPAVKSLASKISRQASKVIDLLKSGISQEKIQEAQKQLLALRDLTMDIYAQGENRCAPVKA